MRRPDLLSLASGVVVAALGALVLLDSSDAADLPLGWVAVAVTAAVGVVLVISGMVDSEARGNLDGDMDRHD